MVCDWARKKVISFDADVNVAPQPLRLFKGNYYWGCRCREVSFNKYNQTVFRENIY